MAVSHVFTNAVADWTGTVTLFNSQGSTTTAAATAIVRPSDWNSAHNQYYTLTGNTTNQSTASGTNVVWGATGAYLTIAGSTGSIIVSSPPHVSSMEFPPEGPNQAIGISTASGSVSYAGNFNVKQPISVSFLRFGAQMTTASTTIGTTGSSANASAELYSTWNAVIYSLGTGASSKSLISVASGSCGGTFRNSISVAANGTQYSVSQQVTVPGADGGTTSGSTQYSISNTNYSLTTNQIVTNFSGNRWIDVPMATSLPAGAYWLVLGQTTSSNANSTLFNAMTNCNVRVTNVFAASQINSSIAIMGSTNLTSVGALIGGGSFSTAGGGTTSALPISAISSSASNPQIYFQLLRSA